ncbi:hypothetical protein FEE59_19330 [Herbaspirillum sp. RU 5E]|nr:hypothetical protein [Herbaspirillum sp. RU 5E]
MYLKLPGISPPLADETLLSFIQRIAQRHDLSFAGFRKIFQTTPSRDMDLSMSPEQLDIFGKRCDISKETLQLIRHSCCRFVIQPGLQSLLHAKGKYRFCTYCWHKDQIPYLRLDWKFHHVRYCRLHGTPLADQCPSCEMPLVTHRSILGGNASTAPLANLATCFYCRFDMRKTGQNPPRPLGTSIKKTIDYQNAIISSILHGYFQTERNGARRCLNDLPCYLQKVQQLGGERVLSLFGHLAPDEIEVVIAICERSVKESGWLTSNKTPRTSLPRLELLRWLQKTGRLNQKFRLT